MAAGSAKNDDGEVASASDSQCEKPCASTSNAIGLPTTTTVPGMWSASLLSSVLVASLLWRSGDHLPLGAVWKISTVVVSYVFFWIFSLSETTMGAISVLGRILFVAAMAVIANDHLSPIAGMALMYADPILAAGFLGFTAAEARQRHGIEQSAAAADNRNLMTKEEFRDRETDNFMSILGVVVLSMVCAARAIYTLCKCNAAVGDAAADTGDAVMELSMLVGVSLFGWAQLVVVCLLRGALVEETMRCIFPMGSLVLLVVGCLVAEFFGMATMLFIWWLAAMATSGFLGYSLSVHAQYKQFMPISVELKETRRASASHQD